MKRIKYLFLAVLPGLFLLFGLQGCQSDEPEDVQQPTRTILAYIMADNSLSSYAEVNINAMMSGMDYADKSFNLLVYQDNYVMPPTLWKIEKDKKGQVKKTAIITYEEQNSVDHDVMKSVINEAFSRFPTDEKALILWSHGTGWMPSENYNAQSLSGMQRAIGQDIHEGVSNWLEVWDLRKVLEDTGLHFEFILFDACHMANAEVAYELKDLTDYLIASSTEIMGEGFPYESVVKHFNNKEGALVDICREYMDYYDGSTALLGGTISLIRTAGLEQLAALYRIISQNTTRTPEEIAGYGIQEYGRRISRYTTYRNIFYDLEHYVEKLDTEQFDQFKTALGQCVLYQGHTDSFGFTMNGGEEFDILRSCGLTVFLPQINTNTTLHSAYQKLRWYQAVW